MEHAGALAIRQGKWKYIPAAGRAGKGPKAKAKAQAAGKVNRQGSGPVDQLYDLSTDLGETKNIAQEHPEIVKELSELLTKIKTP